MSELGEVEPTPMHIPNSLICFTQLLPPNNFLDIAVLGVEDQNSSASNAFIIRVLEHGLT